MVYQVVDAGLLRASVFPLDSSILACPAAVADEMADAENCRVWLASVWSDDARAQAVELAAPALAAAIRQALAGMARPGRVRRIALSLTRYLLRMQFRATPFGLFAGPAPVRLGDRLSIRWGTRHRAVAKTDALWLHDVLTGLEHDPEIVRHVSVTADPTCTVRGTRITVAYQAGIAGPTETSMRRTRAAELALALTRTPITFTDLVAKLQADYPGTPVHTIEGMVGDLIVHRVLLTNLHAPMTCDDALGHLLIQLTALPAGRSTVQALHHLHHLLRDHNEARPEAQPALRARAVAAMDALPSSTDRRLAVDLRPDCDIVLPRVVAREAQRAVDVLARITPYPYGAPAWQDYRARFLERYSLGTLVPVRDLTDPDTGLGLPVGYRGTVLKRPALAMPPRDEYLLALAQDAALTGRHEVDLTEEDLTALSAGIPVQEPAHVEFTFSVLAQSKTELEEGDFELSAVGLAHAAGTLTGRFLSTLPQREYDRFAAAHATLPTLTAGAVRGQISSPPLKVSIDNVSRTPAVLPELLALGEYNPQSTLDFNDLGVIADTSRFYLLSRSTGRLVEPSVMNAVEPSQSTHPLTRFLCEIHRSHTAVLIPFFWGAAARMPYLPRIRTGRTILSPAVWRLQARHLGNNDDWRERFSQWRARYTPHRTVYLGGSDQRLRLDLDSPVHQELLRAELHRHQAAVLHEAPPMRAYGWIGRAHEVTLPLSSRQQPAPPPAQHTAVPAGRTHGRLPATSPWAYLKLYGSAARTQEVLTEHLPGLLYDGQPMWFIRYADPEAHLRIRLRQAPADLGALVQQAAHWADGLRQEGLVQRVQWDTDLPEAGRYGTGRTLEAAEEVFVADSTAALVQMSLPLPPDDQLALTAASYVDIATGFLGSREAAENWLIEHLPRGEGDMPSRPLQRLARQMAAPSASLPLTAAVAHPWQQRRDALDRYRQALDAAGSDPVNVLPSLLHMHQNRVAGVDQAAELTCRRLTRAIALSWKSRREGNAR